jgi:hypothetical protein
VCELSVLGRAFSCSAGVALRAESLNDLLHNGKIES